MYVTDIVNHDFKINKGDDESVQFRLLADGSPADLTGSIMVFKCSNPALSQECKLSVPGSGRFEASFPGSMTDNITNVNLEYKVIRYPSGYLGKKNTIFSGKLRLMRDTL